MRSRHEPSRDHGHLSSSKDSTAHREETIGERQRLPGSESQKRMVRRVATQGVKRRKRTKGRGGTAWKWRVKSKDIRKVSTLKTLRTVYNGGGEADDLCCRVTDHNVLCGWEKCTAYSCYNTAVESSAEKSSSLRSNGMGTISVTIYWETLERYWRQIFASNNPFDDPFGSGIEARLLMYPTAGYHLKRTQYEAITDTMREVEDDMFLLSTVEFTGDFLRQGEHWNCWLPKYEWYRKLSLTCENCLYSTKGFFGVIVSRKSHALVGGKREWINILKRHYPQWERDRRKIQKDWGIEMARPVLKASL